MNPAQDYPTLDVSIDRMKAATIGLTAKQVGTNLISATSSTRFTNPVFWRDPGSGQAFIVLHSTTSKGRSRIRTRLTEGSVVTTLKNTVDNVVTEHGIARLRGASLAERARRLIAVADPAHRDDLAREAHEAGMLRA